MSRRQNKRQSSFFSIHHRHRYCHGGTLRKKAKGRGQRPLACKEVLHAVFKIDRAKLKHRGLRSAPCFRLIHEIVRRYSKKFFVKIEKMSIQGDHLHLVLRTTRCSHFHYFFRVVAGQIAQRFQKEGLLSGSAASGMTDTPRPGALKVRRTVSGDRDRESSAHGPGIQKDKRTKGTQLWLYRPFSRVVIGRKAYKIVMDYVQLNEQEALGKIKYQKRRLRGLSSGEWKILWS